MRLFFTGILTRGIRHVFICDDKLPKLLPIFMHCFLWLVAICQEIWWLGLTNTTGLGKKPFASCHFISLSPLKRFLPQFLHDCRVLPEQLASYTFRNDLSSDIDSLLSENIYTSKRNLIKAN